jgi:hypothetical protein
MADKSIPFSPHLGSTLLQVTKIFYFRSLEGKTWPQYIDSVLEGAWADITDYISSSASSNGFAVCDNCLENIKELMCAGAFPLSGYYNCIYDAIMTFYQQVRIFKNFKLIFRTVPNCVFATRITVAFLVHNRIPRVLTLTIVILLMHLDKSPKLVLTICKQ